MCCNRVGVTWTDVIFKSTPKATTFNADNFFYNFSEWLIGGYFLEVNKRRIIEVEFLMDFKDDTQNIIAHTKLYLLNLWTEPN